MNQIKATSPGSDRPTLVISGGRGNTDRTEVHVHIRGNDDEAEVTKSVYDWFPADALLDALTDAIAVSKKADADHQSRRLQEPAK